MENFSVLATLAIIFTVINIPYAATTSVSNNTKAALDTTDSQPHTLHEASKLKGRNLEVSDNLDMFYLANEEDIDAGKYLAPQLELAYEPFVSDTDGKINENARFDYTHVQHPTNDKEVYIMEDVNEEMGSFGRQIVFRPLFAYRKQVAQRRKYQSKPSTTSSGNHKRKGVYQYNYKYPQYGYGYPDYVNYMNYYNPSFNYPRY